MSDPSLALQSALRAILGGSSPPVAGGRIYDRAPPNAVMPYVTIGEGDTVGDDSACFNASEETVEIHVWSDAVGWPEAKQIAAEIRALLTVEPDLSAAGFRVSVGEFRQARRFNDPDGITRHIVLEFLYLIDHPYN